MEKTETFFITSPDGTTVTTKVGSLIPNILKRKGVKPRVTMKSFKSQYFGNVSDFFDENFKIYWK